MARGEPTAQATGHREIVKDSDLESLFPGSFERIFWSLLNIQSQLLFVQEIFTVASCVPGTVGGAGHAAVSRIEIPVLGEFTF